MVNFQKLYAIKEELNQANVQLVAVTKTRSLEEILSLYESGHRIFGENRVQEMLDKQAQLPEDIQWHQIGHLQSNKVKYIAPFVSLIHSVDSYKLLKVIDQQAQKFERTIPCLLQVHIAQEAHKYGFSLDELQELITQDQFAALTNVDIQGLMGMATFTDDQAQLQKEFQNLAMSFDQLKHHFGPSFKTRSMGMSGDYKLAVQEGSTMVRIGSLLFT